MNWGHPDRGKILLLGGDFALVASAMILAITLHTEKLPSSLRHAGVTLLFMLVYSTCFYVFDLYDILALNGPKVITRLLTAVASGTCVLGFFLFLFPSNALSRNAVGIVFSFLFLNCFTWRLFYKKHRTLFHKKRMVLLIGTVEDAASLRAIMQFEDSQYAFCGFLRLQETGAISDANEFSHNLPLLAAAAAAGGTHRSSGTLVVEDVVAASTRITVNADSADGMGLQDFGAATRARLEEITMQLGVDTIVIRQHFSVAELAESLTRLRFLGVRISTMPDLCSRILEELPLETLSDMWLSFATGFNLLHERIFRRIKRLADLLMAAIGLIVTLPISIPVAIAIKLESPGPVLFRQLRTGWMEKPFTILKFRTMRLDAEADGKPQWATATDPRVTRIGNVLRRLHIDEIPQMFNVLLGEMSFVGPRPERPVFVEQLKQVLPFYSLRHHLPPGITGWAQVSYPYGASVEDAKRKLQFDLFYVRNASPSLDLRILLRTARVVLFRRGSR